MTDQCKTCGQDLPEQRKVVPEITVMHDEHCESPLEWSGMKIVSFNQRHTNFQHPDEFKDWYNGNEDDFIVVPLSYYEHGACSWTRMGHEHIGFEDQFDGVRKAGYLVIPKTMSFSTDKDFEETVDGVLEDYTDWCNGNVYGFTIVDPLTGDEIESSWGYIGTDGLPDEIIRCLKEYDLPVPPRNEIDHLI